ncbi:hypothetical protein [Gracilibacillus sp. YIM 98692]|uniref:hypothetical protein n=1 Tax=Gracilibacillus sp. YIM 98692 TaxID=2663532 RepID=UPI0013D521EF|nr:hypothetical protein [Gracilibacillus sp. YIM 98692]
MPTIQFEQTEIQLMVSELKKQLIPEIRKELEMIDKLPPLMTRKQFMEVANIKDKKCNELFNRSDFPVTRELGHPRVVTAKLFEWLEKDIENRNMIDFPYPYTS